MNPRLFIAIAVFTLAGLFFALVLNIFNVVALSSISPARILNKPAFELKKFFTAISQINSLRGENQSLKKEITAIKKDFILQSEIIEKNAEIKEQISKAQNSTYEKIIAGTVISRSPSKILDSVIVDIGSKSKINIGDIALVDGFLVGIVGSVTSNTSRIDLITNPRILLPVKLIDSRARGLLKGGLKGIEITDIPGNIQVSEKEGVVTDASDSKILPGIPIGTIDSAISAESEILKKFLLRSPINFSNFEVLVIVPTNGIPTN